MRQWFPFYPGDYLRDTQLLTAEEHGCYLLMIMTYYSTGEALPADRFKLSKIFKLSPQKTTKILSTLSKFFDEKDGKYFHHKVEKEIEKAHRDHELKSKAANARWHADAYANGYAIPQPQPQYKETPLSEVQRKTPPKKKTNGKFKPPTLQEVRDYILERGVDVDPDKFFNHYASANWFRGKTKISNWKLCVNTWIQKPDSKTSYGNGGI